MRPLSKGMVTRRVVCAIAPLLVSLLLLSSAYAQFRSDTRLVVLHASVTDHKGKLLTNLDRNAFKVFENGQPQEVKVFKREDVPVSLGIVIDDSGSMRRKRSRVEAAAWLWSANRTRRTKYSSLTSMTMPISMSRSPATSGRWSKGWLGSIRGGTAMRDALKCRLTT